MRFLGLGAVLALLMASGAFVASGTVLATDPTVWVVNCSTPTPSGWDYSVQFTGTESAAATWEAAPPQSGQCWETLYQNPGSLTPSKELVKLCARPKWRNEPGHAQRCEKYGL
jgi:hypothetical protein